MTNYSVLVVSDQPILRRGVACVIESEQRLAIVAEIGNGIVAEEAYKRHKPDVVLIDFSTRGTADTKLVHSIVSTDPRAKIVILAGVDRTDEIQAVLRAGASGYIGVESAIEELLDCLLCVAEGGKYFAPSATPKLAAGMWADALSRREMQILRLLSTGKSNREVGQTAGIAEETVKSHVNRILSKLNVASRTEAVVVAVRRGIIRFE